MEIEGGKQFPFFPLFLSGKWWRTRRGNGINKKGGSGGGGVGTYSKRPDGGGIARGWILKR